MAYSASRWIFLVAATVVTASSARADSGVYVFGVPTDEASGALAVRAEAASRHFLGLEGLPATGPIPTMVGYEDAHRRALEQARDSLDAGRRAYLDLDLERAIAMLNAAVNGFDEALPATDPGVAAELGDALIFLGAAYVFANQERGARTVFRRLHVQMPAVAPDPNQFPPDVVARYEQAAPRDRTDPAGVLEVTSEQPGAAVFVDLQPMGYAPVSVGKLLAGQHSVRVVRAGSAPFVQRVEVARGRTSSVRAQFAERAGAQQLGDAVHMLVTAAAGVETRPAQVDDVAERLAVPFVALLYVSAAPSSERASLRLDVYRAGEETRIFRGARETGVLPREFEAATRSLVSEGLEVLPEDDAQPPPNGRLPGHGGGEGSGNGDGPSGGGTGSGSRGGVWRKWWFWTAVGGAIVAGVTIGVVAASAGEGAPSGLVLEFPRAR